MLDNKEALLLDMNSTFMFGEDRFGDTEDYSEYYKSIGGELPVRWVNDLIGGVYDYLDRKYHSEEYRHNFPSLTKAIDANSKGKLSDLEKRKIIETFSYHEHGSIPVEYVSALNRLHNRFILSLVTDIWAPKDRWVETFKRLGLWELFTAYSFSSDHGMIKPSPRPFELVAQQLGIVKQKCLVIGDSVRRDLGGSRAAGIDCVLVGGAKSNQALASFSTILEFSEVLDSPTSSLL